MRNVAFVLVATCLVVGVAQTQSGAQSKAAAAARSGHTSSAWNCAAPSPMHAVPVGDSPNHMYVVQQSKCTATKGEIAGVKEQEGTATEFVEVIGDKGTGHGIFVESLANGDKLHVSYTFEGTSKDNVFQSGSNKWTIVSGTGMLKGAKGGGTCKAKGAPGGGIAFECTGNHTLAKAGS